MISLEEFKKTLPTDREYSEEEILKLRDNMDSMAEILFQMWLKNKDRDETI